MQNLNAVLAGLLTAIWANYASQWTIWGQAILLFPPYSTAAFSFILAFLLGTLLGHYAWETKTTKRRVLFVFLSTVLLMLLFAWFSCKGITSSGCDDSHPASVNKGVLSIMTFVTISIVAPLAGLYLFAISLIPSLALQILTWLLQKIASVRQEKTL